MSQHARGGGGTRRRRCEMSNSRLRDGDTVTTAELGREFWRSVLLAGGFTVLPRWTLDPVPGVGEHEARIPDELMAALRRLADELAAPLSSVLLTAHAKVLGALSGEREVSTGYAAVEGRSPLLCRMTIEPHSWRAMLLETSRAESELLSHKDFPVDDLRRELGLIKPLFETVFALTAGDGAELAEETILRVGFVEHDGLVLRLRYKTDVLDADCAARIAGYHVTALALIAADPDAEHARQALLSAEELRFQLNGLAGPRRKLPDCRVHELFEERVQAHPDAIAAVQQQTVDVPGAQCSCQSAGTSSVGAGAVSRRCRRSGDRAQSGLDGRCARDLQGRWRVLTHRAAFPGRPHREDALPGRLPARADRTRQHHYARPGARLAVRSPDTLHRRVIRGGPPRR